MGPITNVNTNSNGRGQICMQMLFPDDVIYQGVHQGSICSTTQLARAVPGKRPRTLK